MILQVISKMIQLLTNQIVYITQLFLTAIRNDLTLYIEKLPCLAMLLYYLDIFGRLSKVAGSILNIVFKPRATPRRDTSLVQIRRLQLPNYFCNVSDATCDRIINITPGDGHHSTLLNIYYNTLCTDTSVLQELTAEVQD